MLSPVGRPIQITIHGDRSVTVTVRGEIDFANCDDVSGSIREALTEAAPHVLRVDLENATFIDSTGLGALIEGYRAAADADTRSEVVHPSAGFRRVLIVTGLCELFGLSSDEIPTAYRQAGA